MGRTGWRRRRLPGGVGLALHWQEQKEERESLRHSSFLSTHLSVSAFFSPPRFHTASGLTLFFFFSTLQLDSSHCLPFSFQSRLYMSSPLSSFSLFPFISLLCTFFPLLRLCVCFNHLLIAPSFHGERAWREICASAV